MLKQTQLSPEVWAAIPVELKECGYYSVNEVAWYKADALKVLEHIRACGFGIMGVDIWIPTIPGPTIPKHVYDLDISGFENLPWEQIVEESHKCAKEFIGNFRDRLDARAEMHGLEPVFNIWDRPKKE